MEQIKIGDLVVYNGKYDKPSGRVGLVIKIVTNHYADLWNDLVAVQWFNHPHASAVGNVLEYARCELKHAEDKKTKNLE